MSMARIDENGNVKSFSEWKSIFHTISLVCMQDGSILGVTNSGTLFLVRNGLLLDTREYENGDNAYYLSVAASPDKILVSTTTTEIKEFEVNGDDLKAENATWADTYDKIIAIVKTETDNEKRFALMHKAEDLLMSTGVICPIYYYTDQYMISTKVKGFFSIPLGYKFFTYATIEE